MSASKAKMEDKKLSALQWTWPDWLSCVWFPFQLITSVSFHSYPLFSPTSSPVHWLDWVSPLFFLLSLDIPHPFSPSSSSYSLAPSLIWCFTPLLSSLNLRWHFPNMAARHSFNTFPASPSFTPTVSFFSLLPCLPKQKLAPDLAEVIGIKLQWKWKCQ